jgi:WD40 repeat protein
VTVDPDSAERPCFELRQVHANGKQRVRLCTLSEFFKTLSQTHMGRREFIALSGLASLAGILACESSASPTPAGPITAQAVPTEQGAQPVRSDLTCADIHAHRDSIIDLAFSPDAKLLATTSADNTIKLWDLTSSELVKVLDEQPEPPTSPAFSPNGTLLLWIEPSNKIVFYDLQRGEIIDTLGEHAARVWMVAFSPDGAILAAAGEDGLLEMWDAERRTLIWDSYQEGPSITCIDFTPDGRWLYAGNLDGAIQRWDVRSGAKVDEMDGESGIVLNLRVSPDGKLLVWGGTDSNFTKIWDIASAELVDSFNLPAPISVDHAFSLDGQWLAAAGPSSLINIINIPSMLQRYVLKMAGAGEVRRLAFSPDSKLLAAGSNQGTIAFWRTENFDQLENEPHYCLFDPDATPDDSEANVYRVTDAAGITRTYTLPCGAPLPAGAICTCNCVPGTYAVPAPTSAPSSPGGGQFCTCDQVCTCVPVCVCMAV